MKTEDAKYILKNWDCVCEYGTSPTQCSNPECEFKQAIDTLTAPNILVTVKPEKPMCDRNLCFHNLMNGIECQDCPCYSVEDTEK